DARATSYALRSRKTAPLLRFDQLTSVCRSGEGKSTVPDGDEADHQIGEVAERTGVTQRTLRFYEEKGLLRPPSRMVGGFRLYSEQDVKRVEHIRRLQDLLGVALAEIKEMVEAEEVLRELRAQYRPDS